MFQHVCANCGRLLYSRCDTSHLPRELGVAGPACQLRGCITNWFSMPPFLLLWSKKALGRFLRALMSYDESTNRLKLKRGYLSAPWLHLRQHASDVDVDIVFHTLQHVHVGLHRVQKLRGFRNLGCLRTVHNHASQCSREPCFQVLVQVFPRKTSCLKVQKESSTLVQMCIPRH